MGEPLPVYPTAMSTLAQPTTGPARWHVPRVVAALLSFCAVVLVLVGLFLPLYSSTVSLGAQDIAITITPWSADVDGPSAPGDVPRIGYPLVFAAIALACAAALNGYSATPDAGTGFRRVSATTTTAGGAFLVGTVWTAALTVASAVDNVLLFGALAPGLDTEASFQVGYWLLIAAASLSLGAAVLALIPVRQPTWAQVDADVATPPYGIPPVRSQPPHTASGMVQVDPLTGHPMPPSPPAGVPVAQPQPFTARPPSFPASQPPPAAEPAAVEPPTSAESSAEPVPERPPGPATEQRGHES